MVHHLKYCMFVKLLKRLNTMKKGINQLTDTTGFVYGLDHVKSFMKEASSKYSNVRIEVLNHSERDFIQYTLLTDNRIVIYRAQTIKERVLSWLRSLRRTVTPRVWRTAALCIMWLQMLSVIAYRVVQHPVVNQYLNR